MAKIQTIQQKSTTQSGFSAKQVILMVIAAMAIAIFATVLAIKIFLFPAPFKPVVLSAKEEQQLTAKLEYFEDMETQNGVSTDDFSRDGTLKPEKYSEKDATREISFTEREINAMVAKNTDLAKKLAIDFADDMISIRLLIPLEEDFPMIGGQTLRVKAGAELAYKNGKPVVKLRGVSLMGVPMPNSWLGGLKNIDLISEFGADQGFWQAFAEGVDSIIVTNGFVKIRLKE